MFEIPWVTGPNSGRWLEAAVGRASYLYPTGAGEVYFTERTVKPSAEWIVNTVQFAQIGRVGEGGCIAPPPLSPYALRPLEMLTELHICPPLLLHSQSSYTYQPINI